MHDKIQEYEKPYGGAAFAREKYTNPSDTKGYSQWGLCWRDKQCSWVAIRQTGLLHDSTKLVSW